MNRSNATALGLLIGFVGLAAGSLVAQRADAGRMPGLDELNEHAAVIDAQWREGDAVRPLPWWFDGARLAVGDRRYLTATPLDPLERHAVDRVWFLSSGGRPPSELDTEWTGTPRVAHETQRATLYVAEVAPGPEMRWDGLLSLRDATVHRGETACRTWLTDGWHCGRFHEFLFVGAAMREMDEQPRRCISANAPERGEPWSIRWSDVPVGDVLLVRAGNTYEAVRALRGSNVQFSVLVNDTPVLEHAFGVDDAGYPTFEVNDLPTEPFTLEVRVSATDHLDRLFCFRPQVQAGTPI